MKHDHSFNEQLNYFMTHSVEEKHLEAFLHPDNPDEEQALVLARELKQQLYGAKKNYRRLTYPGNVVQDMHRQVLPKSSVWPMKLGLAALACALVLLFLPYSLIPHFGARHYPPSAMGAFNNLNQAIHGYQQKQISLLSKLSLGSIDGLPVRAGVPAVTWQTPLRPSQNMNINLTFKE